MTDKQEKADWATGQDLDDVGFEVQPAAVRLHGSGESTKHLVIKALICRVLQRKGRRWDTEVKCPGGRVDVLDYGPADGGAVVYEVQTDCTPQERIDKAEQYVRGPVRDVLFMDPSEAPNELPELAAWVEERVI